MHFLVHRCDHDPRIISRKGAVLNWSDDRTTLRQRIYQRCPRMSRLMNPYKGTARLIGPIHKTCLAGEVEGQIRTSLRGTFQARTLFRPVVGDENNG